MGSSSTKTQDLLLLLPPLIFYELLYLLAPIILLDNVVALHKKPHFPAKLISKPEKSFAIGYRSSLLAYMEPSNHLLGNNDFLFLNITLKQVKFGLSSLTKN